MKVYLNRIDGVDDAVISMFLSKRTLTRELEMSIRNEVGEYVSSKCLDDAPIGSILRKNESGGLSTKLKNWLDTLFKWGWTHITMLRFIDISVSVYGLHRGGQDDLDSHAMRMNNRIIRSSTRLADFSHGETSAYYSDKIVPTDVALAYLGIQTPEEIEYSGKTYIRAVNGYIVKGMETNSDAKRGLYMLSIPSNFIFKIQLTEFAHIYKERRKEGNANPEVQQTIESLVDQLEMHTAGYVNRELLLKIKN